MPDLYAPWLAALLPGVLARESRATCHDCAMCVRADGTLPTSTQIFRPEVKCCSFLPWLPNFLVGRILADTDPSPVAAQGRRSVEERVAARVGVTPLGLERPPMNDLHQRHAVDAFGNSRALRCAHYVDQDGGLCGIWRHREATCATWFCRFERGRFGFELWHAVKALLSEVERDLAMRCALDVGVDPEVLVNLPQAPAAGTPWQELEGVAEPAAYAAMWRERAGHELELFRACADRVAGLTWDEVLARCGPRVAARAAAVRAHHARCADVTLPARLRSGAFQVAAIRSDGGVRAVTYSAFDAIDLPSRLVALLPLFDGRLTDEIIDTLQRDHAVELDRAFLRQLLDWGVLAPG